MKKTIKKKLTLSKETIVGLANDHLVEVAGGLTDRSVCSACSNFTECDTV